MPNYFCRNIFKAYLAISIFLATSFMSAPVMAKDVEGIYAKICGSDQVLLIPLGEDNPEPGKAHLTACHAICANDEMDGDEDEL